MTALAGLVLAACAKDSAPTTGDGESFHTNFDGPLGWAPLMDIGDNINGKITKGQLDLWAFDMRSGDELTIEKTTVEGDLRPDFKLFEGNRAVSSATFTPETGKLTKTYVLTESGRYLLGVRAYRGEGAGAYDIKISCTGGPCAGGAIDEPLLEPHQANECIEDARQCAFVDMLAYNGAVQQARARQIFERCLDKVSTAGVSCDKACEGEDATELCGWMIDLLPFYADQSPQCHAELNRCMNDCSEYENLWYDWGIHDGAESTCMFNGANGSCNRYARNHEWCGGPNIHESDEQCWDWCESAWGAWSDDLYGMCNDECGPRPE